MTNVLNFTADRVSNGQLFENRKVNKKELAVWLGNCSPSYVNKLMEMGMPYFKVGPSRNSPVFFDLQEVTQWLNQNWRIQ